MKLSGPLGLYRGYIRIMEKKTETTIQGFRVYGLGCFLGFPGPLFSRVVEWKVGFLWRIVADPKFT